MKIAYLTAGAAGMFCGSCMLDNALARALIRQGHECLLVPIYTPIRTDEENVSVDRVFFGGVNVFLQQKLPFLAYLPRWMDSILNNPALIKRLTSKAGETSPKLLGALAVSMLRGMEGRQRKEVLRLCDWLESSIKPDVILLTNLLIGGCIPELKKRFRSKIFVTLQGDDIFLDVLPEPYRHQAIDAMRQLVPMVEKFVVHSHDYGKRMAQLLSIPEQKIGYLPAGIDRTDFNRLVAAPSSAPPAVSDESSFRRSLSVGYFARMAPEKGLGLLVDAFIELTKGNGTQASSMEIEPDTKSIVDTVQLKMAGWMGSQHQSFWSEQQRKLNDAGLQGRWDYRGSIDRNAKVDFFREIDLFCVPTIYQEPKGLFVLESVAAGVPYLQPSHGAFPELHHRLHSSGEGAANDKVWGSLFEPGDVRGLAAAMRESLQRIRDNPRDASTSKAIRDEISVDRMAMRLMDLINV